MSTKHLHTQSKHNPFELFSIHNIPSGQILYFRLSTLGKNISPDPNTEKEQPRWEKILLSKNSFGSPNPSISAKLTATSIYIRPPKFSPLRDSVGAINSTPPRTTSRRSRNMSHRNKLIKKKIY